MQPVIEGPRIGLNPSLVKSLVQGDPTIEVSYGAMWLDKKFIPVEDVSEFMAPGSSISSDVTAAIHRTCTLVFEQGVPFNPVTDFVQPYMKLRNPDTNFEAKFNLGVYTLATPTYDNSVRPALLSFTGYDLLYLLNQPIGDSYETPVGIDPVSAAAAVIAMAIPTATINYVPSSTVTTAVVTWPFDASNQFTYLSVVNSLLAATGYAPVWVDWNGAFQLKPYVDPLTQPIEWTFDLNADDNIVAEPRTSTQDIFTVPNWWRFVMQNLQVPAVEGVSQFTYIDTQQQNIGSYPNRGRYVKKTMFLPAPTYRDLFAQAIVQIQRDLSPGETFAVSSSPMPLAWHLDVFQLVDDNLTDIAPTYSNTRRVQSRTWTLPLDGSTDMTWVWQTVNATLAQADYAT